MPQAEGVYLWPRSSDSRWRALIQLRADLGGQIYRFFCWLGGESCR